MGSGASTAAHPTWPGGDAAAEAAVNLPFAKWDVERLAGSLDREVDCAAVAAFVRENAIDGATALKMDESKIAEITRDTESGAAVSARLIEILRIAGHDGREQRATSASSATLDDGDEEINTLVGRGWTALHRELGSMGLPDRGTTEELAIRVARAHVVTDDDAEEVARGDDDEEGREGSDDPPGDRQSTRIVRSKGSVFLLNCARGAASAVNTLELGTGLGGSSSSGGTKLEAGFVAKDGESIFGTVVGFLGAGAMGFVYDFDLVLRGTNGTKRCALKTVRSTATTKEKVELEKALASEIAICFASGRAIGISSVIDVSVPEGGGGSLMLACEKVDGGDLEENMHSGAKKYGNLVQDYRGKLYSDEGAATWPLISILLQIFKAFDHIHGRGIIHQVLSVCPCFSFLVTSSG